MFRLLLLSDSFRHPREFPTRVFNLALRLFLLRPSHLRQSFGEPPAGTTQDGNRHIQIAFDLFDRRRFGCRWLPLRFQKQFRFRENTLANRACSFAPSRIQLPGLPCIAMMRDESSRHASAMLRIHAGHRHQTLHRHVR
jgi:hypothetical protein